MKIKKCPFCGGTLILELFNDGFFDYARIRCCRVMEELANVISAALGKMSYDCYCCPAKDFCHNGECEQAWLDWLLQPAKEE